MNTKNILCLISGIVIGAAAGVLGTKKYYQDKYQKAYERVDEYARKPHEDKNEEEKDSVERETKAGGRMSPEERAEIKKKLNKNWEETINYASMYQPKTKMKKEIEDQSEVNSPEVEPICSNCKHFNEDFGKCDLNDDDVLSDDSCSDFEDINDISLDEEAFNEHMKNRNKPPKIISADTYSSLPSYIDQEVLYFYALDEVLTDENEDILEEPERFVGDALTKYGFIDNDEQIIFVMNYELDTCYEIQKLDMSWTDTH